MPHASCGVGVEVAFGSAEWVTFCVPKNVEEKAERIVLKRSCTDNRNFDSNSSLPAGFEGLLAIIIAIQPLIFVCISFDFLCGDQQDGIKGGGRYDDAKPALRE